MSILPKSKMLMFISLSDITEAAAKLTAPTHEGEEKTVAIISYTSFVDSLGSIPNAPESVRFVAKWINGTGLKWVLHSSCTPFV